MAVLSVPMSLNVASSFDSSGAVPVSVGRRPASPHSTPVQGLYLYLVSPVRHLDS